MNLNTIHNTMYIWDNSLTLSNYLVFFFLSKSCNNYLTIILQHANSQINIYWIGHCFSEVGPIVALIAPSHLYYCLMVFNATFNNISVISWRLVLLVEKTTDLSQVTNKKHNDVHLTLIEIRTHNSSGERHRWPENVNKCQHRRNNLLYIFVPGWSKPVPNCKNIRSKSIRCVKIFEAWKLWKSTTKWSTKKNWWPWWQEDFTLC
jgi:hypothetical protein